MWLFVHCILALSFFFAVVVVVVERDGEEYLAVMVAVVAVLGAVSDQETLVTAIGFATAAGY